VHLAPQFEIAIFLFSKYEKAAKPKKHLLKNQIKFKSLTIWTAIVRGPRETQLSK
jgi:hypothetical protein